MVLKIHFDNSQNSLCDECIYIYPSISVVDRGVQNNEISLSELQFGLLLR